jgi:hypothetical protein
MLPQRIWEGLIGERSEVEVTPPLPVPAFLTDKSPVTVKLLLLVPVPRGVVTLTGPVVAPAGTVAWIAVFEVTVKLALTLLNVTAEAPVKSMPLIVTLAPTCPFGGERLPIPGAPATLNPPGVLAVPAGVVTLSGPVVAPAGTVA